MDRNNNTALFTRVSVFAMAFGCVIGWGCFAMPGGTFLPTAGAVGVLLGIVCACVIALLVCNAYAAVAGAHPGAGSSYELVKRTFGLDHAFFSVWALLLAYFAVLLANASAMGILGRILLGRDVMLGFHYHVLGYEIYAGDILLSALLICIAMAVLRFGFSVASRLIIVLVAFMLIAVVLLFAGILFHSDASLLFHPSFASSAVMSKPIQVVAIAVLSPWLFVGFEMVTRACADTELSPRQVFRAAGLAIVVGAAVYCMMTLFANMDVPDGFRSWEDYAATNAGLHIFEDMPMLAGSRRHLGTAGTAFYGIALFCALFSSVLGYLMAASRILKIMADDSLAPKMFGRVNAAGVPQNALYFLGGLAIPTLFVGMNVIGWAVDISALTIAIVYGYICLGAFMNASLAMGTRIASLIGAVCSFGIFVVIMLPDTFIGNRLAAEDYLIFSIWSLLGLIYYRMIFIMDKEYRLGKSMLIWLWMFFFLFFSTNMWTHRQMERELAATTDPKMVQGILMTNNLMRTIVVIIALIILFELFTTMLRREKELDAKILQEESKNRAKNSLLSSMSHDIRTPMNAIVGFTDLALDSVDDPEKTADCLDKIKVSGEHLLSLIEDVIEMSRLNDGIELHMEAANLPEILTKLRVVAGGRANAKNHKMMLAIPSLPNENVVCDSRRLLQALMNLTANAIRFTPDGGMIEIGVKQLGEAAEGRAVYTFSVRDNGMGMSQDILDKSQELLEKEDRYTAADTQGAGLGMMIARKIVDAMDGQLEIESKKDEGTEIFFTVEFEVAEAPVAEEKTQLAVDFSGRRALVVDDIMVNRQIASAILELYGMETEAARDGQEAYNRMSSVLPGHYDLILMDIQMPRMNGYEAAQKIRQLSNPVNAAVPILAMTANVFDEDRERAFNAGMNGFVPKPIDRAQMVRTIAGVFEAGQEGD